MPKERCEYELMIEKYFGLIPSTSPDQSIPVSYSTLCDLLCAWDQEKEKTNKP